MVVSVRVIEMFSRQIVFRCWFQFSFFFALAGFAPLWWPSFSLYQQLLKHSSRIWTYWCIYNEREQLRSYGVWSCFLFDQITWTCCWACRVSTLKSNTERDRTSLRICKQQQQRRFQVLRTTTESSRELLYSSTELEILCALQSFALSLCRQQ